MPSPLDECRMGFSPPGRRSLLCHYFYQTPQTQYLHRLANSPSVFRTPPPQAGRGFWFTWRGQCLRRLAGSGQANISDRDVASDVSAQSSLYPAWWTEIMIRRVSCPPYCGIAGFARTFCRGYFCFQPPPLWYHQPLLAWVIQRSAKVFWICAAQLGWLLASAMAW